MAKVEAIKCDGCGKIFSEEEIINDDFAPNKVQRIVFHINKKNAVKCYSFDFCNNCLEKIAKDIQRKVNEGELEKVEIKSLYKVIVDYLKEIGADGLCNPDARCGCGIDNLSPCDCIDLQNCVPARKTACANCPERDSCSLAEEYEYTAYCFVPMRNEEQK